MHNLRSTDEVELVIEPGEAREALAPSLARLERAGRWRVRVLEPAPDADAPAEGSAERARIVVGDPDTAEVRELFDAFCRTAERVDPSLEFDAGFLERVRGTPNLVLVATLADPDRPGLPATFALGATAHDAAVVLGDVTPCAEPSWRLFVDGEFSKSGLFWRPERGSPPAVVDVEPIRTTEAADQRVVQRERFDVRAVSTVPAARLDKSIERYEAALARLERTLLLEGESASVHPIVHAHALVEAHLALAHERALAVANPLEPVVHALIAPGLQDDGGAALASLVAREVLGPARAPWLASAVGIEASSTWWGQGLGRWLAHLARAGLVPTVAELVDPACTLTPLALEPARAGFVRFLATQRGRDELRALWRGERELVVDAELEERFAQWLSVVREANDAELDDWRTRRAVAARKRAYRHGFSIVAPPFEPRVQAVGFGSSPFVKSLSMTKSLRADAVAFVFPAYADPGLPAHAGAATRAGASTASDLELWVGAWRAKERGLALTLRPRLHASPTSSLAGWTTVVRPGGWDAFFDATEVASVHFGLLAELCGAELFCFSGEIANASVTKPTPSNVWERDALPSRLERWRRVIERTRAAFTGGLTFAAESLYEAEGIEFWGQLDFIGVDLWPETIQDGLGDEFSRERVVRSITGLFGACNELAAIEGRPVLVTEFGFSSTAGGWRVTSFPEGDYDGLIQQRLFEAWGEALGRMSLAQLPRGGAFLWRWSTDPLAGGEGDRGYTPLGKPAEHLIRPLFERP